MGRNIIILLSFLVFVFGVIYFFFLISVENIPNYVWVLLAMIISNLIFTHGRIQDEIGK